VLLGRETKCVLPREDGLGHQAYAGVYNFTHPHGPGTQDRYLSPEHITFHPLFNAETLANDLAILQFTVPFDLNTQYVRAICLPPTADTSYVGNPDCNFAGWGVTSYGGQQADVLKRMSADIITTASCQDRLNRTISANETCIFDEVNGQDTPCDGDFGGVVGCSVGGQFYAAGIASKAYAGCNPLFPQIFANVAANLDWIRTVTGLA